MALKYGSPQNKHNKKLSLAPLPNSPQIRNLTEETVVRNARSTQHSPLPIKTEIFSPKNQPSKLALGSLLKPSKLENISSIPPLPSHTETGIMSAKDRSGYADFMLKLYKTPSEKQNTKAFMSFREIASNQPPGKLANEMDEVFLPPNETNLWKVHLDFNKRQENMFKKTIHDVFKASQSNFNKLVKDKEKRHNVMPQVKIYQYPQELKNEPSKPSTPEKQEQEREKEKQEEQRRYQRGSKLLEYASSVRLTKGETYKFYEYPTVDGTGHLPSAREGATLTVVGNNIYLYGGLSKGLHNEMEVLNAVTFTWKKIEQRGDIPSWGRLGHIAEYYQSSLLIFGGEKQYNTTLKIRECLSDVRIFVPDTNEWKYQKCHGELIEPRRNHAGTIVGKHLVIHGGISSSGNYLNDLKVLDLVTNKWSSVEETGKDAGGMAFHRACLVVLPQRKDVNLFKMMDMKPDAMGPKVAEEGIYFFGGKTETEETTNKLRILKIGTTPFKWITPKTEGTPPDPRYLHSMVYCKKLNALVVHGGRSDNMHLKNKLPYLSDFFILQLENLTWISVVLRGAQPSPRCSHTAAVVGTKLLIFGGIYFGNYCPPDPKVIQMDSTQVYKLENNKRESINKSVDFNLTQKHDEVMMPSVNPGSSTGLTLTQIKSYDNVVSFLPIPQDNKIRKMRTLAKPLYE